MMPKTKVVAKAEASGSNAGCAASVHDRKRAQNMVRAAGDSRSVSTPVVAPIVKSVIQLPDTAPGSTGVSCSRSVTATTFHVTTVPLAAVASHFSLRADPKFQIHWGARRSALFPESIVPQLPLHRLTLPLRRRKLRKGVLAEPCIMVELEDVEQRTGTIMSAEESELLGSDKLLFGQADVLTTRLRPNLGKTILNDQKRRLAGTTAGLFNASDWLN